MKKNNIITEGTGNDIYSIDYQNSKYKVGEWVKFISDQPDIYVGRYVYGNIKIERKEHVGIIKDVHYVMNDWYLYTIDTFPVQWHCFIVEEEIKCKLAVEYKMKDSDELFGYMWLKPDLTGINADVFVDDGKAYLRDNHVPLLIVRNGIGRDVTEFIPISISETPTILDDSIVISIDTNIIKQIMDFIKANIYKLMAMANGMLGANDFVSKLKLSDNPK